MYEMNLNLTDCSRHFEPNDRFRRRTQQIDINAYAHSARQHAELEGRGNSALCTRSLHMSTHNVGHARGGALHVMYCTRTRPPQPQPRTAILPVPGQLADNKPLAQQSREKCSASRKLLQRCGTSYGPQVSRLRLQEQRKQATPFAWAESYHLKFGAAGITGEVSLPADAACPFKSRGRLDARPSAQKVTTATTATTDQGCLSRARGT